MTAINNYRNKDIFFSYFLCIFFFLLTVIITLETVMSKKKSMIMVDSYHYNTSIIIAKVNRIIVYTYILSPILKLAKMRFRIIITKLEISNYESQVKCKSRD